MHKSTAFRLVATLERHDIVSQTEDRGKYRLGVGVLRLAGATRVRLDLVQESRPVTLQLATTVGETVNIVVLSGQEALYLDQVAGPSALQMHMWAGQRVPAARDVQRQGPAGLRGAGHGGPPARTTRWPGSPSTRSGPSPSWSPSSRSSANGAMPSRSTSWSAGLTAVSAPIVGIDGHVVASVSASGPSFRLPPDRLPAVAAAVQEAAAGISRRLGWHGVETELFPSRVPQPL